MQNLKSVFSEEPVIYTTFPLNKKNKKSHVPGCMQIYDYLCVKKQPRGVVCSSGV